MDKIIGEIFEQMQNNSTYNNSAKVVPKASRKTSLIIGVVSLLLFFALEYMWLVPLTFKSPEFILFLMFILFIFSILQLVIQQQLVKSAKFSFTIIALLGLYLVIGSISGAAIFHASSYQQQLDIDQSADFYADNDTISYQTIPVVDYDSAMQLGDRKMGEMVEYVSQFEVTDAYEQINYQDKPYRVTPLEYSDLIKWFSNKNDGLPAYIMVDMVNQEVEVVVLEEGMKYSNSDLFSRNINRHIRLNYPTLQFDEVAFEVDDNGIPFYIAPTFTYEIGIFGGKEITGAIVVNAVTGEHNFYGINEIPSWIDRVYPSTLIEQQLLNWGKYGQGYINSLFGQKGVLQTTNGYNYLAIDGDVYYYTGLTSVSSDASNVGFVLVNLRTKESKFYKIPGAQEESAKSSAQGQVQHLGYQATFPILVNAGGVPSYFMSLKDDAGLVKMYAFVSVEDYQIVATGETVASAQDSYYALLESHNKLEKEEIEENEITGKISAISTAVKDGNSMYYILLEDQEGIFVSSINLWDKLPLLTPGQIVTIHFDGSVIDTKVVTKIYE